MKLKIKKSLIDGFNILKKNPKIFVPVVIITLINLYVSYSVISAIDELNASFASISESKEMFDFSMIFRIMFQYLKSIGPLIGISMLVNLFLGSMIIKMIYDASKRKLSIANSAKYIATKYITLLIASILFGVITILGFAALFIPGIFLLVRLYFFEYNIIIDNKGIVESLKNSWKMTKGNWWRIFGLVIVFGIISSFASSIINLIPIEFLSVAITSLIITPWQLSSFTMAYLQLKK